MLHGALTAAGGDGRNRWTPTLTANYHPSYYGMMVAQFLPRAPKNNTKCEGCQELDDVQRKALE